LPFLLVGPFTPDIRAQNDFFLAFALPLGFFCVTGAFSFDPVARLYFALPFAVSPAPLLAGSFSPRPIDRETDLPIRKILVLINNTATIYKYQHT
tara:strand:- start:431 stop:715 length:285 start_codon:yes stop_codon:yes gene_type:complete